MGIAQASRYNMERLKQNIERILGKNVINLPFSVYTSIQQQRLLNVPILKPTLIIVINGEKVVGKEPAISCQSGEFVFLADTSSLNMRNIPKAQSYFALLIEFELEDFSGFVPPKRVEKNIHKGQITQSLNLCLDQFIQCAEWAPQAILPSRRQEILHLLCELGHQDILAMVAKSNIRHQIVKLYQAAHFQDLSLPLICTKLAMSESTLRRRLKTENTSLQEIKDQTKLGLALHLLQTTEDSIGIIAERCGYLSAARFSQRFKSRFNLTPSELRKTKMAD